MFGIERLNQHCVNVFGKGLNVTDVHLYVKGLHNSFKNESKCDLFFIDLHLRKETVELE